VRAWTALKHGGGGVSDLLLHPGGEGRVGGKIAADLPACHATPQTGRVAMIIAQPVIVIMTLLALPRPRKS